MAGLIWFGKPTDCMLCYYASQMVFELCNVHVIVQFQIIDTNHTIKWCINFFSSAFAFLLPDLIREIVKSKMLTVLNEKELGALLIASCLLVSLLHFHYSNTWTSNRALILFLRSSMHPIWLVQSFIFTPFKHRFLTFTHSLMHFIYYTLFQLNKRSYLCLCC